MQYMHGLRLLYYLYEEHFSNNHVSYIVHIITWNIQKKMRSLNAQDWSEL